jgi:hypothetical protein
MAGPVKTGISLGGRAICRVAIQGYEFDPGDRGHGGIIFITAYDCLGWLAVQSIANLNGSLHIAANRLFDQSRSDLSEFLVIFASGGQFHT